MLILGISAFYHDSAATLIKDGKILFAAQEERFSRIKHDNSFPEKAIKECISFCNVKLDQIDYFCFYEKPFLKFSRLINTYFAFAPRGHKSFYEAFKAWTSKKLFQKKIIIENLYKLGLKTVYEVHVLKTLFNMYVLKQYIKPMS